MIRRILLSLVLLILVACGGAESTSSSRSVDFPTTAPTNTTAPKGDSQQWLSQFPKLREPMPAVAADDSRAMGELTAPVTIIEYSDFECPFCQRNFLQVFPDLKAKYIDTGKVRYVFRNYIAVPSHTSAPAAGVASLCAAEQGKFWELHDELYQKSAEWTADPAKAMDVIKGYSKDLGLDMTKFDGCINDPTVAAKLQAEGQEAQKFGAQGTPAFFVGQYLVNGAFPLEAFDAAIEAATKEAK